MNAEALFREGREALLRGDYDSACDKLRRSDQLDPAPGTQLNLGECEALRGRVATAFMLFRAVEQQLDPSDIRLPVARSKREAIEFRLPKLVIALADSAPPDTRVQVDNRTLAPVELRKPLILDPGTVELTVMAPGHVNNLVRVSLEEGKTTSVVVEPLSAANEALQLASAPGLGQTMPYARSAPARQVSDKATGAAPRGGAALGKTGGALLGVGIGGLMLGGAAGALTLDARSTNKEHCSAATHSCDSVGRDAASRGRLFGALTTTGLVIGVAGVGLGTYLIVRSGKGPRSETSLLVRADGSGSSVTLQQSF